MNDTPNRIQRLLTGLAIADGHFGLCEAGKSDGGVSLFSEIEQNASVHRFLVDIVQPLASKGKHLRGTVWFAKEFVRTDRFPVTGQVVANPCPVRFHCALHIEAGKGLKIRYPHRDHRMAGLQRNDLLSPTGMALPGIFPDITNGHGKISTGGNAYLAARRSHLFFEHNYRFTGILFPNHRLDIAVILP